MFLKPEFIHLKPEFIKDHELYFILYCNLRSPSPPVCWWLVRHLLDLSDCFLLVSFILFSTPSISCKLEVRAKDIIRFRSNIFWCEYFVDRCSSHHQIIYVWLSHCKWCKYGPHWVQVVTDWYIFHYNIRASANSR